MSKCSQLDEEVINFMRDVSEIPVPVPHYDLVTDL